MIKKVNLTRLAKSARNSRSALNKLFDNIYPIVWHFYRIRLNDIEDAKDITQDACIKIVKNLDNFDSKKAGFSTWMYRIIRNLLIDLFRKRSLPIENIDINILEGTESPINKLIKKEELDEIKTAFNKLGTRQKEILEMRYFFNMKNKDIALSLNVKERTVSSLIKRGNEKLQTLLDKNGIIL